VEYRIFGPGGSPSEGFRRNIQEWVKLDGTQRDAIGDWLLASKDCDPSASPLPASIAASTLLPEQFRHAADGLRGLLWAWQEYGLQLSDIERDLLLIGLDSEALAVIVPFLARLSRIKRRVWACDYATSKQVEGLPTMDGLNFTCEARAVFGGDPAGRDPVRDSYKQFLGVIPVIIMELITSDNNGNNERTAIQLSEEDFEWLRKAIERTHEQLSIMKERTAAVAFDGNGLQ
jgi:hypothetical protein